MNSVLIIGAGLSGLAAARTLTSQGISVTLLDKGRAVGGRLTTRSFRIEGFGEAIGDRGAQYFTARDDDFKRVVDDWLNAGVVKEWASSDAKNSSSPRYVGTQGMVGIARYLAEGLDVRVDQKVVAVRAHEGGWTATTEDDMNVSADALLVTAPVPQSLALLSASGVALPNDARKALEKIKYEPCIALMALLAGDSMLTSESAVLKGNTLKWIADNKRKGISALPVMTLHAAAEFSEANWDKSDAEIAEAMLEVAKPFLGAQVLMVKVHRWRYSQPSVVHAAPMLAVGVGNDGNGNNDGQSRLVFAGDAFVDGRLEGAYLSGVAAAQALLG
jgi:renalase